MLASLLFLAQEASPSPESSLKVLPDGSELLYGTIFFVLLFLALWKFVFPKMTEMLNKRTASIQGKLEEADHVKRDADQVLEQYRAQLAEARTEVGKIIEEGKKTAEALRADLVRKAETEAQEIVARARQDVAGERDRAMAELRQTVGDLSISLASRVIEKELSSSESARALVDRAISELARNGQN
jgi:F-type H+-transporting ATPase subunit b